MDFAHIRFSCLLIYLLCPFSCTNYTSYPISNSTKILMAGSGDSILRAIFSTYWAKTTVLQTQKACEEQKSIAQIRRLFLSDNMIFFAPPDTDPRKKVNIKLKCKIRVRCASSKVLNISKNLSCPMSKFIHNRGLLNEPTRAICCAARPRNFYPKFCTKSSLASQTPSAVNLYVININHYLVKFKKMRVVLKQRLTFSKGLHI